MVAYLKPQQSKKEESERLRGERDWTQLVMGRNLNVEVSSHPTDVKSEKAFTALF